MKEELVIRVASDLKSFVKENELSYLIEGVFRSQFKLVDLLYPDEQALLEEAIENRGINNYFILNLDVHSTISDPQAGYNLQVSRLYDPYSEFKGFLPREGAKPIPEQIQEAKNLFEKSGKKNICIYDEDSVCGFLIHLIRTEFKNEFPELFITSTSQYNGFHRKEILDLKDFIFNCKTLSSGLLIQKHSLSDTMPIERVPYVYNKRIMEKLGSVTKENYLQILNLSLTMSLLYAEQNYLSTEDVLEQYKEIIGRLFNDYYN